MKRCLAYSVALAALCSLLWVTAGWVRVVEVHLHNGSVVCIQLGLLGQLGLSTPVCPLVGRLMAPPEPTGESGA